MISVLSYKTHDFSVELKDPWF